MDRINELWLILTNKEDKYSEDKGFIEDLKELLTQDKGCFIVFDKKDITLKIDIDKVKLKMPEQEFYSEIDVKINDKTESEEIIKMINKIPNHLAIRLEADYTDQIIELMKSKIFIEKLRENGIKFLYNDIEIKPRIIECKQDEDDLKNEVKEIKAKKYRLNMDCDK